MTALAYYLEALAPFHLGLRGVGVEQTGVYAPADTLFAALCHALRQLYGSATLEAWLDTYTEPQPAVVLSSAFPYAPTRDGVGLRLWPRPVGQPPDLDVDPSQRKTAKGIAWLSEDVWRAWVGGGDLDVFWSGHGSSVAPHLVQGGSVWLSAPERALVQERLWAVGDAPRVTVDRVTNASAVYQAGRVQFAPGGGLWFAARWLSEAHRKQGEAALCVLGDAGLGGERSAGHGQFALHGPHEVEIPAPAAGEPCTLLSPFYPRDQAELDGALAGDAAYHLQVRRGWMSSPDTGCQPDGAPVSGSALRRKAVRLFGEGSLLRARDGSGWMGGLADVTPDVFRPHRVYRYGCALLAGYGPRGERQHHA